LLTFIIRLCLAGRNARARMIRSTRTDGFESRWPLPPECFPTNAASFVRTPNRKRPAMPRPRPAGTRVHDLP
jgi:hypothetical protein